jgi:sugar transferase (PEP-CTERM/EpsH1 system associated)
MSEEPRPLILHVIHHLVTGGMENGLVNLVNGLPPSEFRHAIVCIEDFSEFRNRVQSAEVEVTALHRSRVGIWRVRRRIFSLCRRIRPAIVHTRNLSGLDALLPARLAGVPVCLHGEHGWDVNNLHGDQWKPALLRRLHSPLVTRYVTVSRHLQRYLVDRVGIAEARITHICNGVDTTRFTPATAKTHDLLPPPMRGDSVVVIGTVGRAQAVKDQVTLLRAVARIVAADPAMRAVLRVAIVGGGPLLSTLREEAAALGIADLAWLPGGLDDVPAVLRQFDVFVLPSLAEGISNTILEAMATGLPIVATGVGGNTEIVEEGAWGRFFTPQDVDGLASQLLAYVRDPALRAEHAAAARHAAVTRFSLRVMVERYRETYAALLRRNRTVVSRTDSRMDA